MRCLVGADDEQGRRIGVAEDVLPLAGLDGLGETGEGTPAINA
jgi:hypothetical protein